jgi:hypothetical protein
MGGRLGSLSRCTQVRTKVYRKDECWSMRLIYDPRDVIGVMTVRPRVAEVLQIISESTLVVLRACTGQLRRIR